MSEQWQGQTGYNWVAEEGYGDWEDVEHAFIVIDGRLLIGCVAGYYCRKRLQTIYYFNVVDEHYNLIEQIDLYNIDEGAVEKWGYVETQMPPLPLDI